jgi:hypothetical protein
MGGPGAGIAADQIISRWGAHDCGPRGAPTLAVSAGLKIDARDLAVLR